MGNGARYAANRGSERERMRCHAVDLKAVCGYRMGGRPSTWPGLGSRKGAVSPGVPPTARPAPSRPRCACSASLSSWPEVRLGQRPVAAAWWRLAARNRARLYSIKAYRDTLIDLAVNNLHFNKPKDSLFYKAFTEHFAWLEHGLRVALLVDSGQYHSVSP